MTFARRIGRISLLATTVTVLCSAGAAHATHFRYGNLSWQRGAASRQVIFQLQDAFRRTADASSSAILDCVSPSNINTIIPCTGPGGGHGVGDLVREDVGASKLQFGDGTCMPATCSSGPALVYVVTAIDTVNNWSFVEAVDTAQLPTISTAISHTYGGTATSFTAKLDDCCRISNPATPNGHINNPDKEYTLSTNVLLAATSTDNHSPISTQIPIVTCCYPATCTFSVPASDPDGDPIRWRLATGTEASASGTAFVQPGPPNAPNAASINATTGLYTWNDTGATVWTSSGQVAGGTLGGANTTLYSTQVIIEDLDGSGNVKSRTPVDFLIQLKTCVNHAPTCSAVSPQNVVAGNPLSFNVSGADQDSGDTITLNGVGFPAGSTMTPGLPTSAVAPATVSSTFNWTPTLAQVGQYILQYSVTDQGGQQALCPVTINVSCSAALCDDGNPCTDDTCTPTGCLHTNNTAPCNDGDACTQTDTCSGGICIGGNPKVCTASDQCHVAGVCDSATGVCSNPPAPNNTACSDGNACTLNDSCQGGVCTPSGSVACAPLDQCHVAGVCDPANGTCSNPPKGNGSSCNDGNACTQSDTCQGGVCTGANPVTCTALDDCHQPGTCNPATGVCSNPLEPNGTACNNPGNLCNQTNTCQNGTCTGSNPVTCAPLDQCHVAGTCNPGTGTCSNPTKSDGSSCNDGDACTQTDTCQSGTCTGGNPVVCTALDQCHVPGSCMPATGICSNPNKPDGSSCSDGNACTQTDTCTGGVCGGANPVVCHPLDQCHVAGTCDPGSGTCSNPNAPNGTGCSDGDGCTVNDTCQSGACQGGGPKNCADTNPCTDDACDSPSGTCFNVPNTNACDDGNACTINDTCADGVCAGSQRDCDDANPCTTNGCNVLTGCFTTNNSDACDDGNACTVGDTCGGGACQPGSPRNCDDGNPCTDDSCDVHSGCVHTPNNDSCDDGNACTVGDRCAASACQPGAPRDCNDHNDCTNDGCNPSSAGGCFYTFNTAGCDDGNACTTADHCVAGQCTGGPAPNCNDGNACTTDSCHPINGCEHTTLPNCQPCSTAADCQNGTVCDGTERCVNGMCAPGTPPNCLDTNPCTNDACDPVQGCTHLPNSAACDDGNACTTGDTCSNGTCVGGQAPDCNDGNVCTTDGCDPSKGCTHTNNTDTCDDGNPCTTGDVCHNGQCGGSGSLACDDQNPCTTDSCDPLVPGGCTHQANSAPCNDGDPCTMNDICAEGHCAGQPRTCDDGDPCTVDSCDPSGGNFLCNHTKCFDLPGSPCPPGGQCTPNLCGNGVKDPGETCDPPDARPIPGVTPPQPMCRPDCTYCGDGHVDGSDGESCDDGNLVSGCDPAHPTVPLDNCQNNCTMPICHDPAKIVNGRVVVLSKLYIHGLLASQENEDFSDKTFVLELTDDYGRVLYRSSIEAGTILGDPLIGTFKFTNKLARVAGGLAKIRMRKLVNGYRATILAFGDTSAATENMVTHVYTDPKRWTVVGHWKRGSTGWRFTDR